jgi:transposase-like protein
MTAPDPTSTDRDRDGDEGVTCPFCESTAVTKDSEFGPEISKSQYYCTHCETPFERIKWGESKRPDTGR